MRLTTIFKQFKFKISFTISLVLLEGYLFVLFPLYIGYAIDGLLNDSFIGLYKLGTLGVGELIVGAARRFYDSRIYAKIYEELGSKVITDDTVSTTSILTARVNMFKELVEFFENTFPELFHSVINLMGTIVILYSFSTNIFLGCLLLVALIILVFGVTTKRTILYNHHYNNALEEQVNVIEKREPKRIRLYMKDLMRWNIKLSDLETINFSIVWLSMIGLLIYSIVETVNADGTILYGAVLSVVMYVFQFAESSLGIPEHYQEWLRLNEISSRLQNDDYEDY